MTYLIEYGAVADDDHDAGDEEAREEEELLGGLALPLEDGAGEGGGVQTQSPPHPQEWGNLGGTVQVCFKKFLNTFLPCSTGNGVRYEW